MAVLRLFSLREMRFLGRYFVQVLGLLGNGLQDNAALMMHYNQCYRRIIALDSVMMRFTEQEAAGQYSIKDCSTVQYEKCAFNQSDYIIPMKIWKDVSHYAAMQCFFASLTAKRKKRDVQKIYGAKRNSKPTLTFVSDFRIKTERSECLSLDRFHETLSWASDQNQ